VLGGTTSRAYGINSAGQVVGYSTIANGLHAFLWSASGGMQDLGTLGGNTSDAYAINSAGQVVGGAAIVEPWEGLPL
jgi:probable HAF family extracellular repeat protein